MRFSNIILSALFLFIIYVISTFSVIIKEDLAKKEAERIAEEKKIEEETIELSIGYTLIKMDMQKKIKLKEEHKKIEEFKKEISGNTSDVLIDGYNYLKKEITLSETKNELYKIKKEISRKRILEYIEKRSQYAEMLDNLYKEKYLRVKAISKNLEDLELDWYLFASKEKRYDYLEDLLEDLQRLHFKHIVFKNSINNKVVKYNIDSPNDIEF